MSAGITRKTPEMSRRYTLKIAAHKTSGWLIATIDGLPGFFVQGSSVDQVLERAPRVLQRYLEREGSSGAPVSVAVEQSEPKTGKGFTGLEHALVVHA
ncbi:MAG: type II toxin-antitoxin system HicB family antitoxin [Glycocaulis sp.]